jgi:hypothetical protein
MKSRDHYQSLDNAELIQLTRGYHPTEDFVLLAAVLADRLEAEGEARELASEIADVHC